MSKIVDTIESACDVVEILQNAGHQAVFAGGCVRDLLLGVEPKDIDIATSATPEQVEALFPKTVAVGKSFGVIRVLFDEEEFEVATFRTDSSGSDGRRPDSVSFSSMEEDAKRRDLTINAIFLDPIAEKIHDFVGGQKDITARRIRFVGNPDERIREDALRLLRVVRFASRGGWLVDQDTMEACRRHANAVRLVSAERIADELTKIFTQQHSFNGYSNLVEFGLWEYVLGDVDNLAERYAMLKNARMDVLNNKVLAWAIVLSGGSEVRAQAVMNRLRFDGETISSVVNIVAKQSLYDNAHTLKGSERMKLIADKDFDNSVKLLLSRGNKKQADYLLHIQQSTPAGQIRPAKLADGNDLIALGMKPGKDFKAVLESLADEQREGRISTREQALAYVKNMAAKFVSPA